MKTMLIAPLCCQRLRVDHQALRRHPPPSGQQPAPPPAACSRPLSLLDPGLQHPLCSSRYYNSQIKLLIQFYKATTFVS